jgi:type II secretory pathway pseudopilin PulG
MAAQVQGSLQSPARERIQLPGDERGYLMVALLVAMSIMAILMTAALPAWRTLAQREKEAELIFRGEQYARAIGLFQRRYANASPPNLDVLVNERFLRKKYKDPITNEDFQLVSVGSGAPGMPGAGQPGQTGRQTQPPTTSNPSAGRGRGLDSSPSGGRQGQTPFAQPGAGGVGVGGIAGVVSKSSGKSFRLYNGRDTYNQWVFMGVQQSNRAGGAGGRAGGIGGPGGATGGPPGAGGPGGAGPGGVRGGGPGGGRDGRGGIQPPMFPGTQPPGRGFPPPPGGGRGAPPPPGGRGRGF